MVRGSCLEGVRSGGLRDLRFAVLSPGEFSSTSSHIRGRRRIKIKRVIEIKSKIEGS